MQTENSKNIGMSWRPLRIRTQGRIRMAGFDATVDDDRLPALRELQTGVYGGCG